MKEQKEHNGGEEEKMAGKDILMAMNYLEEGLVEIQPYETEKVRKSFWKKWTSERAVKWAVAAAATLCLLGSGIVFAASKLRWSLIDNYNNSGELGYQVEVKPEQVPVGELGENIQKIEEQFKEEAADGILPEEGVPRGWVMDFASEKEVMDYVGYAGLRESVLDLGEDKIHKVTLRVLGDREGNATLAEYTVMQRIPMERELEHIVLDTSACIYTDRWPYDFMGISDIVPGDGFQGHGYVTQSGKEALVLYPEEPEGVGGWYQMIAYVVDGGVVYKLDINHYYWEERDAEYAEELLHQWLEQF